MACLKLIVVLGLLAQLGSKLSGEDRLKIQIEHTRDGEGRLVLTEQFYIAPDGKRVLHGARYEWFAQGKPRLREDYLHGVRDGWETEWNKDGQMIREGRWKNGKQDGVWSEWDSDGRKTSEKVYKSGRASGRFQWYQHSWDDDRTTLSMEEVYNDDGRLVELTCWYPNGQKQVHGHFKPMSNAEMEAEIRAIVAGKKKLDLFARQGRQDGEWVYWDKEGNVVAKGVWKVGKPWEGACGVFPGSPSGRELFSEYREGRLIKKLPIAPGGYYRLPDSEKE